MTATPPPTTPPPQTTPPHTPRLPSWRVSAALAVGMLAIGVATGAAIGPSSSSSFAGEPIPQLLPAIAGLAGAGRTSPATVQPQTVQPPPPPVSSQETPTVAAPTGAGTASKPAKSKAPASGIVSPTSPANASKPTTPSGASTKQVALPPVTHVWLIVLSGATFAQAAAQPAAAPYIDAQLVPAGALLGGWSSLQGSALASEAGLLGGEPPQTLDSISAPPCPEGAAGAQCKPETAGALSAADEFLKQTIPSIVSSVAYREHGLIVIAFGQVGNATASSLPADASTATLSSLPPSGVLLLSPFVRAGSRPGIAYDPTSPEQSLSELLH